MALPTGEEDSISLKLTDGFNCTLFKQGLTRYEKLSYPVRFGVYHEVSGRDLTVHFNLRGHPVYLQSTAASWPHPHDWIKITPSGKRLYLSSGSYLDGFSLYGEHFIPVPDHSSNSLFPLDPFGLPEVIEAERRYTGWIDGLMSALSAAPAPPAIAFLKVLRQTCTHPLQSAMRFHTAIRGTVPVLPPDTRHTVYDVIPLIISDGCLSNCGFCTIKTGTPFRERGLEEIREQADSTVAFLGPDLRNFNAVFLGQNDALACSHSLIDFAISLSLSKFEVKNSLIKEPALFMFGSVKSLLAARESTFHTIEASGFRCYINIGFESFHQPTLDLLKKPANASDVRLAFQKALDINRRFSHIEITGNFVLGTSLPDEHNEILSLTLMQPAPTAHEGQAITIYLSPLSGHRDESRQILRTVRTLQQTSNTPCYLYLLTGL